MSPQPRKYKGKFAREVYVRSEVRFDSRKDLELVRRAAKAAKARSMNAWIVKVLLEAAKSC